MFVWKSLSLLYLEQGVYATELYRETYPLGTEYVFLALMTIFFASSMFFIKTLDASAEIDSQNMMISSSNEKYIDYFIHIHIFILLYLYVNVFLTGIYFSGSVLTYIRNSRLPFVNTLGSTVSFLLLVVDGVSAFCLKKHRKKAFILFGLSVLYMLIIGAKFSGIYQYVVFFIIPYVFNYALTKGIKIRDILKPKLVLPIVIFVCLILVYSVNVYSASGVTTNASDLLVARLFNMQSGSLWGVNEYVREHNIELFGSSEQRSLEFEGLINNWSELDERIGLGKVMYLITPYQIAYDYLSSGLRFSGWFLVVSILSFGYVGSAIFCIILGFIFGIICVALRKAMQRGDLFILAIAIFEYCHFYDYYRIGNFSILFNLISTVCLIVLMFYIFANKNKSQWKRKDAIK